MTLLPLEITKTGARVHLDFNAIEDLITALDRIGLLDAQADKTLSEFFNCLRSLQEAFHA